MRPGAWWPIAVVAVLGVTVAANAWLLLAASDPQATVVEPDYYRRALKWDSTAAVAARSARLGWSADAAIGPLDREGRALVEVRVRDAGGEPVRGARVRVTAIHNREADRHLEARLGETPGGYAGTLALHHAGLWELRLEVLRAEDRYLTRLRRDTGGLAP